MGRRRLTNRLLCTHPWITCSRETPHSPTARAPDPVSDTSLPENPPHAPASPGRSSSSLWARSSHSRRRWRFAAPAGAITPCGKKVLNDWWDNGRVDRLYPLHCYEEAIDSIPADIRDYSDAEAGHLARAAGGGRREARGGRRRPVPGRRSRQPRPGCSGAGWPEDPARRTAPRPPRTSRAAPRRCPSRSSSSAGCRSRCSRPAGSATSHAAARLPRVRTTRTTRSTRSPDADVTKV